MRRRSALPLLSLLVVVAGLAAACSGNAPPDIGTGTSVVAPPGSGTTPGSRTDGSTAAPPGTPPTAPSRTSTSAPIGCTIKEVDDALVAAGRRPTEPPRFGCDGQWAFAFVAPAPDDPATVVVLQGNGPRWAVVPTAAVCAGPGLPPAVRQNVLARG